MSQTQSMHANTGSSAAGAAALMFNAGQNWLTGAARYTNDFFVPFLLATQYFQQVEAGRLLNRDPVECAEAYAALFGQNLDLISRGVNGLSAAFARYYDQTRLADLTAAWFKSFFQNDPADLYNLAHNQALLTATVARTYPDAIDRIEPEYGFHFESGAHPLVAETDRFRLYQISPSSANAATRQNGKPICILPPYVLGANILGFLPGENRSYAHSFANQGVPTYIRILKDIAQTPALQKMTGEDDARDTAYFCNILRERHGRPVTLNGYCQGGYNALCNLLSGKLDGLVDAFITCVSPMDGTRSKGLATFLKTLHPRFNDLAYGVKHLPNGQTVADGLLMGWVYKLKSIDTESPLAAYYRDLMMFARQKEPQPVIGKTAAALNYWLNHERFDLPLAITHISFAAYNTPIAADGSLPIKLFGTPLNLKRLKQMNIPWLICYGTHDDLVETETALAPLDFVEAEVSPFPKGHVAIATSWSAPDSACALHTRFGQGHWRGPVRFHLDLEAEAGQTAAKD